MSHDTMSRLVYMANQIGNFFTSQKQGEAVPGIAQHIKDFWDPRMRAQMEEHIESGGAGLQPLVLEALKTLPRVSRKDIPANVPSAASAHH
ncbi:MAG TPA: formate dehydrogenase subunit delta [Xanthobacteraceae bacterium]|nr:formate dehydrogenase subunit delta [Xanthobacteraceae bacterium]